MTMPHVDSMRTGCCHKQCSTGIGSITQQLPVSCFTVRGMHFDVHVRGIHFDVRVDTCLLDLFVLCIWNVYLRMFCMHVEVYSFLLLDPLSSL